MFEYEQIAEGVSHVTLPEGGSADPMRMAECLPEVSVPVGSLGTGYQLRGSGVDAAHVRLLADAAGSVRLPSILVQQNSLRVIDGMHRIEVAKLRGEWSIRARLIDCSDEAAFVLAIRSNTLHGLPLSRADRIASTHRVLAAHPDWSDRAVAGITGLSAKAVASLRDSAAGAQIYPKRIGRDGKRRPVTPGMGRLRVAEYINAHPDASLRQVARETDVSVGTVHDVREKLRRGVLHLANDTDHQTGRIGLAPDGAAVNGSPATGGTQLRASVGSPRQLTWKAISAKLACDPALRYTEDGRAFLRWITVHSMQVEEWRELVDAIPARWLNDVRRVAAGMSAEWRQLAECIRGKQEAAG